jgi:hypothetical protein
MNIAFQHRKHSCPANTDECHPAGLPRLQTNIWLSTHGSGGSVHGIRSDCVDTTCSSRSVHRPQGLNVSSVTMQALRRLGSQAGLLSKGVRSMGSSAKQVEGKAPSNTVDRIGLFATTVACVGIVGYDLMYPEEEFEGAIPNYPYLRMRTRDSYPWGTSNGLFEYHQIVGGTGEHHEH